MNLPLELKLDFIKNAVHFECDIPTNYQVEASIANTADKLCYYRWAVLPIACVTLTLYFLSFPFLLCHACCVANGISCSKLKFFHIFCPSVDGLIHPNFTVLLLSMFSFFVIIFLYNVWF